MKNIKYLKLIGIFLASILIIASCKKDDMVKLDPNVKTLQILNITDSSAIANGYVIARGDGLIEQGICFNTEGIPTVADQKVIAYEYDNATYSAELTGLDYTTKYIVRAYATNSDGSVIYGDTISFVTNIRAAKLIAAEVTNISGKTATSGGEITDLGGGTISAKGVCWSMNHLPTIENDTTLDGSGSDAYVSNLKDLVGATTYYLRAYAINKGGVGYSPEISFTTEISSPTLSTDSVTNIANTTATVYANALYTGGADITERGFCWALTSNPSLSDNSIVSGDGTGVYSADLTGLTSGKKYYLRAYAINSQGTSYGNEISFNTVPPVLPETCFLVGSINGWDNHGLYLSNLGNGIHVGYQYLENGSEFKIFPQRGSWDNGWGRDGSNTGTVVSGGGNIPAGSEPTFAGAGFYEIKFDLVNHTVALTPVAIGVIGNAQAGGWDTDVNLTYNTVSKKWEGAVTFLSTGEYKFRANDDWAISFGGSLATIVYNGGNLATPGAGSYNVILDISGAEGWNATVTPAK